MHRKDLKTQKWMTTRDAWLKLNHLEPTKGPTFGKFLWLPNLNTFLLLSRDSGKISGLGVPSLFPCVANTHEQKHIDGKHHKCVTRVEADWTKQIRFRITLLLSSVASHTLTRKVPSPSRNLRGAVARQCIKSCVYQRRHRCGVDLRKEGLDSGHGHLLISREPGQEGSGFWPLAEG